MRGWNAGTRHHRIHIKGNGAFISTLMRVGVVTLPVEIKYFGKKLAIYRNLLAFLFSFIVAYIIGLEVTGI